MAVDPICGMHVDEKSGVLLELAGQSYFFCSRRCRDKFIAQQRLGAADFYCAPPLRPLQKNKLFLISALIVLVLASSFFVAFLVPLRVAFFGYLKAIWWAVAAGLLLGGIIDYYVPQEYISKILSRKRPSTIFNAVLLGFLMSACSHGILALSIQLHKKGASAPAVVSFLMASPWANFAVTMMLLSLFGLKGALIIVAALIIAINTGFVFMFLERRGLVETNKNRIEVAEGFSILKDMRLRARGYRLSLSVLRKDFQGVMRGAASLADMVLWWILFGVLLASLAGAYIPVHFFHKFMGPTIIGLLVTLALATVIEVCSEGSSPLAFEIFRQTGALGNSFVFLMAGVATDYTEIGLLWQNVGRRTALWLPVVTVPQVVVLGYLLNLIFR